MSESEDMKEVCLKILYGVTIRENWVKGMWEYYNLKTFQNEKLSKAPKHWLSGLL